VLPIPREMSFEEAAAIPEVFLTAYDALVRQLAVRIGERILVHAIDASSKVGAAQVEKLAGTNGVHAVVDLVGGDYLRDNLRVLAPRGRLLVVGLTAGNRSELDLGVVLRKRLKIIGTALRSRPLEEKAALAREFSQRVIPFFESRQLRPVIERVVPFTRIADAHSEMASNSTFGKLVLRW
jgi:NADPH:quinone reductase-like Zn-dependent oxidoreductase